MRLRCDSIDAQYDKRCQKPRGHGESESRATHQNGDLAWQDTWTHVGTKAHEAMESMAAPDPEQQLIDWWMGRAAEEVERTVPKAVEYSSTDLADIGHVLARTAGRTVSDEEAAELGIFFYLQGKLSRWAGAVAQGKRPSDDTIFDIGVYCRMAQRIRHSGGWPGMEIK